MMHPLQPSVEVEYMGNSRDWVGETLEFTSAPPSDLFATGGGDCLLGGSIIPERTPQRRAYCRQVFLMVMSILALIALVSLVGGAFVLVGQRTASRGSAKALTSTLDSNQPGPAPVTAEDKPSYVNEPASPPDDDQLYDNTRPTKGGTKGGSSRKSAPAQKSAPVVTSPVYDTTSPSYPPKHGKKGRSKDDDEDTLSPMPPQASPGPSPLEEPSASPSKTAPPTSEEQEQPLPTSNPPHLTGPDDSPVSDTAPVSSPVGEPTSPEYLPTQDEDPPTAPAYTPNLAVKTDSPSLDFASPVPAPSSTPPPVTSHPSSVTTSSKTISPTSLPSTNQPTTTSTTPEPTPLPTPTDPPTMDTNPEPSPPPTKPPPTIGPTTSEPSPAPTKPPPTDSPATPPPSPSPTKPPPTDTPTTTPVATPEPSTAPPQPVPVPPTQSSDIDDFTVILTASTRLTPGSKVRSPNGNYEFELANDGKMLLFQTSNGVVVWDVEDRGAYLAMQPDGNLLLRSSGGSVVWRSKTSNNPGAYLRLDNGGQIAIAKQDGSTLWFAGVPRGQYTSVPSNSLTFPIRGAFYYPWFPETWTVRGSPIQFSPTLGLYSNGDKDLQQAHVDALEYAHVEIAVASWWGPGEKLDRARITNLMDKSVGKGVTWTIYHEEEREISPGVDRIRSDLAYIKKWFAWHPAWAHIDGRPVIFLWNDGNCGVPERWMEAARGEWYIVGKLFRDHDECPIQPDHWHEYGPAKAVVDKPGWSYAVSPGFYHATSSSPRLPRVPLNEWRSNVQDMVDSNEPWQLITTFNEWGEGTAVESADEWSSSSGFGRYVDVLHDVR